MPLVIGWYMGEDQIKKMISKTFERQAVEVDSVVLLDRYSSHRPPMQNSQSLNPARYEIVVDLVVSEAALRRHNIIVTALAGNGNEDAFAIPLPSKSRAQSRVTDTIKRLLLPHEQVSNTMRTVDAH